MNIGLEFVVPLIVLAAIFLAIGLRWLVGGLARVNPDASQARWYRRLSTATWLLLMAVTGSVTFLILGIPSLPLLFVMSIIVIDSYTWYARAEYNAFFAMLQNLLGRQMPLATALRLYSAEGWTGLKKRAAWAAARIEAGESAEQALRRLVPARDVETTLALRLVPELTPLGAAIAPRSDVRDQLDHELNRYRNYVLYLGFLCYAAGTLLFFVSIKVRPVMIDLRDELSVRKESYVAEAFAQGMDLDIVISLLFLTATLVAVFWLMLISVSAWSRLPLLDRCQRLLDRARVLEVLAVGVERQRPLGRLLEMLAEAYPKRHVCRKLTKTAETMNQGRTDWDAFRHAGLLGREECRLLESAERSGNLPWALRQVAQQNRRRHVRRLRQIVQFVTPLVLVILGLSVLAMFMDVIGTLVDLIHHLSLPTLG
jgi:type II secretory pathway component PulF